MNIQDFKENIICLFKGECYKNHYDYYIIFDGTVVKADNCYRAVGLRDSYCTVEGKNFYNVSYSEEFSYRTPYQKYPIIIPILVFFFILCIPKLVMMLLAKSSDF